MEITSKRVEKYAENFGLGAQRIEEKKDIYERLENFMEKAKDLHNFIRKATLILYVGAMNCYNLEHRTGHISADVATGRSKPTALESSIINYFNK